MGTGELIVDRLASHPGEVKILIVASCYVTPTGIFVWFLAIWLFLLIRVRWFRKSLLQSSNLELRLCFGAFHHDVTFQTRSFLWGYNIFAGVLREKKKSYPRCFEVNYHKLYSYFNLRCRIKASSLRDKIGWWSGCSLELAYRWRWKLQVFIFVRGACISVKWMCLLSWVIFP